MNAIYLVSKVMGDSKVNQMSRVNGRAVCQTEGHYCTCSLVSDKGKHTLLF